MAGAYLDKHLTVYSWQVVLIRKSLTAVQEHLMANIHVKRYGKNYPTISFLPEVEQAPANTRPRV